MTDKEKKVVRYQKKFSETQENLEMQYDREFSSELLSSLLGHYFETDDVHTFLLNHRDIDSIDLNVILQGEINSVIGSIEFISNEFEFLISNRIEKARIKEKGFLWEIHEYDIDSKPSNPHAHCYSLNVKLHLGTGELYRYGKICGKINKKEFGRLKEKIVEKGIDLTSIK